MDLPGINEHLLDMIKRVLVLSLSVLLAVLVNSRETKNGISPYDLMDEAQAELDALKQLVESAIEEATNVLDDLYLANVDFSNDVLSNGELSIDRLYQPVVDSLNILKEYALNNGKDITVCTDGEEDRIYALPDQSKGNMQVCIRGINDEGASFLEDSKYYIDVTITKVNQFDYQLGQCESGSIFCIQPIITEIELANVQLKQEIEVEVDRTDSLLEELKLSHQSCSDLHVNDFGMTSHMILDNISICANGLVSGKYVVLH